jgi:hypothetical protein
LKGLLSEVGLRNLTDYQNQRNRILLCGVHGDRRVRRAGTTTDHDNSRPVRQSSVRARHKTRTAFVPARHNVNLRKIVEGVENTEVALAGNKKDAVDTVGREYR